MKCYTVGEYYFWSSNNFISGKFKSFFQGDFYNDNISVKIKKGITLRSYDNVLTSKTTLS